MDKSLGIHSLPRLNHEEIENLNRLITHLEIELIIKTSQPQKPKSDGFTGKFYQNLKN